MVIPDQFSTIIIIIIIIIIIKLKKYNNIKK